jgi:XTP/dITP diphosphohydrolase
VQIRDLGHELVLASHNQGKVRELAARFEPYRIRVVSAATLNLPAPAETGATFHENALIKARAATLACGRPVLADDSGISVPAMGGAPGVHSADWASPTGDFAPAFVRIAETLGAAAEGAAAYFSCVLALAWPDGRVLMAEGRVDGHLAFPPTGKNGFGFDPIFIPEGDHRRFAEMEPADKARFSHRGRALDALLRALS